MNLFTRNQTRERMKNKKTGELDHDKSTPAIPLCAANHVSSKQPLLQRFLKELNQIRRRPDSTANHANHAKIKTEFPFAYLAYFAVHLPPLSGCRPWRD